MLFLERNEKREIVAIRQGKFSPDKETASLLDEEVINFLNASDEFDLLMQALSASDKDVIRVLEDLVDVLIAKKLILFTELPHEAQNKLLARKQIRSKVNKGDGMVEEIL